MNYKTNDLDNKKKGKFHPRIGDENPELTLSLTSALDGCSTLGPDRFTLRRRPGTHCTGGWVGPKAGLDGYGKSLLHRVRSPDRPTRSKSLYRWCKLLMSPMKIEEIQCSETSAHKIQKTGIHLKEKIIHP